MLLVRYPESGEEGLPPVIPLGNDWVGVSDQVATPMDHPQ